MTPKEKARVLENARANSAPYMKGVGWAFSLSDGCTTVMAKYRYGVLMLDFSPSIGGDNKRYSRAKKIADRHAASYFKYPVMVGSGVVNFGGPMVVFRYRGRKYRKKTR